ncbi:DMT family transporter [Brackiella oedipodis]|uniref:DMT family transporter n=1 Tax=Brackiella oedipodis TaxID=124225 RepID=UPI00048A9398|nr:DMT family transporter [Brackiella oedipodis]
MSVTHTQPKQQSHLLLGTVCGLLSALIWGSFPTITHIGQDASTGLDFWDITFLRFATAGILMLPILLKYNHKKVPWYGYIYLVTGIGAPYILLLAWGLQDQPVRQYATLVPGTMIFFSLLISVLWLRQQIRSSILFGAIMIIVGIVVITLEDVFKGQISFSLYLPFLICGFIWGNYTVTVKRYGLSAWHATAIVGVLSAVLFSPLYFAVKGAHIFNVSFWPVLVQILYQGLGSSILALYFFSKSIELLGAARAATFTALIPVVAAIIAWFAIHEASSPQTMLGLCIITVGMLAAVSGPFIVQQWQRYRGQ